MAERSKADLADRACYEKAVARGQATFTLVAQDASAPEVVCDWITRNIYTCPADKLREALERAIEMRDYPTHKVAD